MSRLLLLIWKKTRGTLGVHLWSGPHNKFQVYERLLVPERSFLSQTNPIRSFALCGISLTPDVFYREINWALPEHCRFHWSLLRHGRPFVLPLLPFQEQQKGTWWLLGVLVPSWHITRHCWWPMQQISTGMSTKSVHAPCPHGGDSCLQWSTRRWRRTPASEVVRISTQAHLPDPLISVVLWRICIVDV